MMIVTRSLTRKYGNFTAVDGLSMETPAGQVVGFLGPNGAGKTTTIRMITGFLPPTSGQVTVDSLPVSTHSAQVRRRIGYLPEGTPLYGEMRVAEYLRYRACLFGLPGRRRRQALDLAISRCWLKDVVSKPICNLSKGYRQRVGLAAALLHEPPVLILDEPTSGLDPAQVREVRHLIRELAGQHTILLSTHILDEVEKVCDRVVIINRGRICAQGTIDELKTAAADNRYSVEVDSADAAESIRSLPGVASVESAKVDDFWHRVQITASAGAADLREPLARMLADRGATVREIHLHRPGLEQLFVQLMAGEVEPSDPMGLGIEGARQ